MNKQVTVLQEGAEFGELALNADQDKRQASVVAKQPCLLAFVERSDYRKVLKKAVQKENTVKMQFLKANRIFEEVSTGRLQKMAYQMQQMKFVKGQTLYREGELVNGIYIIQKGSLQYTKNIEYEKPIESSTKNKWFQQ